MVRRPVSPLSALLWSISIVLSVCLAECVSVVVVPWFATNSPRSGPYGVFI